MARTLQEFTYVNFSKGLITEGSNLVTPMSSAKEMDNVDINIDGVARRRPGADFETAFQERESLADTDFITDAITSFDWAEVNNDSNINFVVIQIGETLYFHDSNSEVFSAPAIGTVDISTFTILTPLHRTSSLQFSDGKGVLFVVGTHVNPFKVEYNPTTFQFTATQVDLQIRDFEGSDDGLAVDNRPASLSSEHHYNLRNQGWPTSFVCSTSSNGDDITTTNPITYTNTELSVYPSNADIIHSAKLGAANTVRALDSYWPDGLNKIISGNTRSAKGHYILDAFNRDRTSASGISGLYDQDRDTDITRPSTVEFYAGRVWFAGLVSNNIGGNLYFSQQLNTLAEVNKCYQEADPTAEDINDLIATDGGVIKINEASNILKILSVNNSLLVFSSNGI